MNKSHICVIFIYYIVVLISFNTMHNLNTVSFNCNGLKSSTGDIAEVCGKADIVFLQETWLTQDELPLLRQLHVDFDGAGVSSMNTSDAMLYGRTYGGVAILWRKSLAHLCIIIKYDDQRLLGLNLSASEDSLFVLNVYMPYQCPDNYESFMNYLGKMSAIIEAVSTSKITIIGDFNANLGSKFDQELSEWCAELDLIISDISVLGRDSATFTYVSDAHHTCSWLDHAICSPGMHKHISQVKVYDRPPSSDHLPLHICFNVDVSFVRNVNAHSSTENTNNDKKSLMFKWCDASDEHIHNYTSLSTVYLQNISIPVDALSCKDSSCNHIPHINKLDTFYDDICDALYRASVDSIDSRKACNYSDFVIPGWNDHVKSAHTEARQNYIFWHDSGKPRQGEAVELMRRCRLNFKYILRQCQTHEEIMRANAMATSLTNKDQVSFWKHVGKINNLRTPLPSNVNGVTGHGNITDMWSKHYEALLNSIKHESEKASVIAHINDNSTCSDNLVVNSCHVNEAIHSLKLGKSSGCDYLSAEHFKFCDHYLHVLLSMLFSGFIVHGHLPSLFMKTAIVLLIKDKSGDRSDVNNYRPIPLLQ